MSWSWSSSATEWALSSRVLRLVALGRVIKVRVCPICACLIVADADEHHESIHRVGKR